MAEQMIRAGGHRIGEHGWEPASLSAVAGGYDPADQKVSEVLEHVGDDRELAAQVLAAEQSGRGRKTLLEALEALIASEPDDDDEDTESD